jgi:hypothetical protein
VSERLSPRENTSKFRLGDEVPAAALKFFQQHGFVVFQRVFTEQERARTLRAVDRVVAMLPPEHPDLALGTGPDGRPRAGRVYRAFDHAEDVRQLATDQRLQLISSILPGEPRLMEAYKSGVIFQDKWPQPGSGFRGLRWHDDYDAPEYGRTLTVGIYFDRSTQANGAMRLVPGSQEDRSAMPDDTDVHPHELAVIAEPGDVSAHINGIWHCSPLGWDVDPDTGRRRVLYFTYADREPPQDAPLQAPAEYRQRVDL